MKCFSAYSKNEEMRLKSSSGGIFTTVAEYFLKNNGIVYGVVMSDDNYSAEFKRVDHLGELDGLRGSKYFQARVVDTCRQVKNDLLQNIPVLFTGTGCQINGLKLYLQKEYDNLFCIDVICHGVPSPMVWKKYLLFQENKMNEKITNVSFRDKCERWEDFGMRENNVYINKDRDIFMQFFLRDYCLRPSCYNCVAKKHKMSDMTIADFWGIDEVEPSMNDHKGNSLVILRNGKADTVFDSIKHNLVFKEVTYEDGVKHNPAEYISCKRPPEREHFLDDFKMLTIEQMKDKYLRVSFKQKVRGKLSRIKHKIIK